MSNNDACLIIRGIDPLLFRDARPFSNSAGAGAALSLNLPLPSTIAGMLRTRLGNALDWDWTDAARQAEARNTAAQGPLMYCNEQPVFPMPADSLIYTDDSGKLKTMTLRPDYETKGGCDMPVPGLLPLRVTDDGKPSSDYHWWPLDTLAGWLASPDGAGFTIPAPLRGLPREERVHVGIEENTGCSREGMLFTTQSVAFEQYPRWPDSAPEKKSHCWEMRAKIKTETDLSGLATLGGERRLAAVTAAQDWPECPEKVKQALQGAAGVRMMLATPAVFAQGWLPDFLDSNLEGILPDTGVRVRLKAAAVKRREPLTGWDYRIGKRGPKPVFLMTPAGSVYFFEVLAGDAAELVNTWLQPIPTSVDDGQPTRDGFGMPLWGVWNPAP